MMIGELIAAALVMAGLVYVAKKLNPIYEQIRKASEEKEGDEKQEI